MYKNSSNTVQQTWVKLFNSTLEDSITDANMYSGLMPVPFKKDAINDTVCLPSDPQERVVINKKGDSTSQYHVQVSVEKHKH